jgi:hypothetical protein
MDVRALEGSLVDSVGALLAVRFHYPVALDVFFNDNFRGSILWRRSGC